MTHALFPFKDIHVGITVKIGRVYLMRENIFVQKCGKYHFSALHLFFIKSQQLPKIKIASLFMYQQILHQTYGEGGVNNFSYMQLLVKTTPE